jgi:phage replication O-like protein O
LLEIPEAATNRRIPDKKRVAASGVQVKRRACLATGGFLMTTANQATFPGFQFPNTTQIPNDVFDTLMPHLSGGELKVLLYICRRTFGFRKDCDRISLSQISKGITTKTGRVLDHGTGLCKRHVINALKTLEKKNIIIITRTVDETGLNAVNTYSLNIPATPCGEGTPSPHGVVNASAPGVVNSRSPGVVNASAPTKQRKQKKEEQKKDTDDVVAHDLENFGMTKSAVTTLIQRYPVAYIREKLAMAQGLMATGSCLVSQNPAGWLRRAIEDDYRPPQPAASPHQHSGTGKKGVKAVRAAPKKQHVPQEEQKPTQIVPTEKLEPENPSRETEALWQQTLEKIQAALPPGEAAAQLKETTLIQVTETAARIRVPNAHALAWLERRLYGQIAKAMKGILGKDLDLQFVAAT